MCSRDVIWVPLVFVSQFLWETNAVHEAFRHMATLRLLSNLWFNCARSMEHREMKCASIFVVFWCLKTDGETNAKRISHVEQGSSAVSELVRSRVLEVYIVAIGS